MVSYAIDIYPTRVRRQCVLPTVRRLNLEEYKASPVDNRNLLDLPVGFTLKVKRHLAYS